MQVKHVKMEWPANVLVTVEFYSVEWVCDHKKTDYAWSPRPAWSAHSLYENLLLYSLWTPRREALCGWVSVLTAGLHPKLSFFYVSQTHPCRQGSWWTKLSLHTHLCWEFQRATDFPRCLAVFWTMGGSSLEFSHWKHVFTPGGTNQRVIWQCREGINMSSGKISSMNRWTTLKPI